MSEPCPNPWYFGGCEPAIEYLWRWTPSWERWVLYTLALMLAYLLIVAARVSYRYYLARRTEATDLSSDQFRRARKQLIADLSVKVGGLKSVVVAAPYLGLVGTCVGMLGGFTGYSGTRRGFVVMASVVAMAALLSTAAGILVALPATCLYNFFRARVESLETEVESKWRKHRTRGSRVAQSLPLAPRFSRLPFALIAAPALALYIMAFLTFASFHTATGLPVGIAPSPCATQFYERVIVLHVTANGKVLLNTEKEDWNKLAYRLSQIYSTRVYRTLYLLADDDVPLQMVADAIDIVNGAPFTGTSERLGIRVELITPATMSAHCPEVWRVPPIYPRQSRN